MTLQLLPDHPKHIFQILAPCKPRICHISLTEHFFHRFIWRKLSHRELLGLHLLRIADTVSVQNPPKMVRQVKMAARMMLQDCLDYLDLCAAIAMALKRWRAADVCQFYSGREAKTRGCEGVWRLSASLACVRDISLRWIVISLWKFRVIYLFGDSTVESLRREKGL